MGFDFKEMERFAVGVARGAGRLVTDIAKPYITRMKGDVDISTNADEKSEKFIIDKIKNRFPEHSIVSEESRMGGKSEFVWIIDPLDGTKNFKRNIPLFCISIALEYKGETVVGVVFDPNNNRTYHATKGCGAFLDNRKIGVSDINKLSKAFVYLDTSTFNLPEKEKKIALRRVSEFVRKSGRIRSYGCILCLCYLAQGSFDVYFDPVGTLKETDFPAALLIAKEAGAFVSFEKNPVNKKRKHLLVTNGKINKEVLEILKA